MQTTNKHHQQQQSYSSILLYALFAGIGVDENVDMFEDEEFQLANKSLAVSTLKQLLEPPTLVQFVTGVLTRSPENYSFLANVPIALLENTVLKH